MKKNEKQDIMIFTHNDLDALGCLLVINEKFPDEFFNKHISHTNYQDISTITTIIINQCKVIKPKLMIITDVSFSTSKDELTRLYQYCIENNIPIIYLDHHLYPSDFFEDFPKMKTFWDKKKCASKICLDTFLPELSKDNNLYKLLHLIDVYDIWQDQHKMFPLSQKLNDYFWHRIGRATSIIKLSQELKLLNFNLPSNFIQVTNDIKKEINDHLLKVDISGLIHRNTSQKVSLYFSNYHFNPFMIKEHEDGQIFVINICNWGLIKVRVNQHNDINETTLDNIRYKCTGTVDIGHAHAFTWKSDLDFANNAPESLAKEAKRICQIIQEEMENDKKNTYESYNFDDDIPF